MICQLKTQVTESEMTRLCQENSSNQISIEKNTIESLRFAK